jgi:photosystem II stability/assembly factor-like uncharacterized protein
LQGGTNYDLNSVYFTDANMGYAVGGNGIILKTTNGGTNWVALSSGTNKDLTSVFFTGANTGCVVGEGGLILKTTNGGTNWLVLSSGTSNMLYSVYFTDANTGYAVGDYGTILKTTNGGINWVVLSKGTSNSLNLVYFTDANTGYAVGEYGTILKTTNGGGQPQGVNTLPSISNSIKLYPNPAFNELTVETSEKGVLSVFNLNSELLIQLEITEPNTKIDISTLPKGLYVLKLVGEKDVRASKFIKD